MFVSGDRWMLRSLPLAAVAGVTGQALMGGGIASCCISNNEQWQALHGHNKSQTTQEILWTRPGRMSAAWKQCLTNTSLLAVGRPSPSLTYCWQTIRCLSFLISMCSRRLGFWVSFLLLYIYCNLEKKAFFFHFFRIKVQTPEMWRFAG